MKKVPLVAFALFAAACGSASLTTPSRVLAAGFHGENDLRCTAGVGVDCSGFNFSITSDGPDCADPTSLQGSIKLVKDDGTTSTANWELTLGSQAAGIIKPGQTRTAKDASGILKDTSGHGTYFVTVTSVRPVACQ